MMIKLHAGVVVGDYIRGHGHRVNPSLAQTWRKVIDIKGDQLVTVDRHGNQREFGWRQNRKWKTWQPGDPRTDGDNL